MKSISAKSEKRGFKQLAIDHAEKVVLGFVVVFVLLAVSPMMTVWSRYAKTPEEMAALASKSAEQVAHSTWPKDEASKYPLTDTIGNSVQELERPLDVSRFDYTGVGLTFALYPKQEPIKEPKFWAVEDPIATASRALIALRPDDAAPDSGDGGGPSGSSGRLAGGPAADLGKKKDDSNIPLEYRRRSGRGTTPGTDQGMQGRGGGLVLGQGGGLFQRGGDPTFPLDPADAGMAAAGAGAAATHRNARGMRFVAVRAVFPLKREIAEFRKALHAATDAEVADLVIVIDFEIERQMKRSGPDPWSGPWDKLDIQRAKDVIDEAEDFDQEVVPIGITDPTMTMGLLLRVVGEWGDLATHPWLKNYELSPEERREQELLNARTVAAWEKYLKNKPKPLRKRGFADQQRDLRGMTGDLMQSRQGIYDRVLQDTATTIDPKNLRKRLKEDLKRQTASGRLLLFRYFDFDVEPGRTYRYRIRLELANPNYEAPAERLQNPDSAKGQTRETPWSKPTPPTTVPKDTRYFLTRVTPPRGTGEPIANLDIYEWFPVFGTIVNGTVGAHFGGFVSNTSTSKKVWVLRPAQPSFDEESDIPFYAPDLLVDISAGARLRRTDHPDLQLPRSVRGGAGITTDQTLIVDPYAQLVSTDPETVSSGRERAVQELKWQNEPWESLKEQSSDEGNPLDGDTLDPNSPNFDANAAGALGVDPRTLKRGKKGRKKRRRSSLRKRRSSGRSARTGAYTP